WLVLGIAGVLLTNTPVWADEAAALLTKMRQAVHTLNYSGTLVYSQGNNLTHYQISHRLENGAEKQSVVQLMPAAAATGGAGAESFSLQKFQQMQPTEEAYRLDLGGQEVVANRSCQIVVARPRDRMRYLQRYCIEPDSGMLMKYSLMDGAHQSVE
ncbi:MAG: sigma-E factor regulatory protein RseB domain-containing protein, partial [Thiothrix sp.]